MTRRVSAFVSVLLSGGLLTACLIDESSKKLIPVTAQRFMFRPDVIEVERGKTVVLEIKSIDRLHGFSIPKLGVRADLVPGQITRVEITPSASGDYVFACDIFCGGGHDEMAGILRVVEAARSERSP